MIKQLLIFIGPPGSGKGTLAFWLAKNHQFTNIGTGWLLRNALKNPIQKAKLTPILQAGNLVDDLTMSELLFTYLKTPHGNKLLLDGYPRNLAQNRLLNQAIKVNQWPKPLIVIINSDLKLSVERILGRWSCPQCAAIYHDYFSPPLIKNRCDYDQHVLIKRDDGQQIKQRFDVFQRETLPLVKWILKSSHLHQWPILKLQAQTAIEINQKLLAQFCQQYEK